MTKQIKPNKAKAKTACTIIGIVLLVGAVFMSMAFISFCITGKGDQTIIENVSLSHLLIHAHVSNWMGALGALTAYGLIIKGIGLTAFLIVMFLFKLGYGILASVPVREMVGSLCRYVLWGVWLTLSFGAISVIFDLQESHSFLCGQCGYSMTNHLIAMLGWTGLTLTLIALFISLCLLSFHETILDVLRGLFTPSKENVIEQPKEKKKPKARPTTNDNQTLKQYKFPPFSLLKKRESKPVNANEQKEYAEKIRQTLKDYDIEIKSISAIVGPTVTLFEIVLQNGTKISKVRSLQDEIAMSIASESGVRIIAPIPGKSAIGIEVPNKTKQIVSIQSCIEDSDFQETDMQLPVALGRTITNELLMFDLATLPHLLIAGSTGQGKSVGLNAIITSLLYKKHPSQLKMVLIDPKQLGFSLYENIEKHYLATLADSAPIITDMQCATGTLKSLCVEMENRYALLKDAGEDSVAEYNQRILKHELDTNKLIQPPSSGSKEGVNHRYLPYLVVIIDEYGDLILAKGKEIETPIARLAAKGRAAGIHVIIATQRPDAKIVTGVIKANFPARIAFRVSDGNNSRIILDQTGAQSLIGRGDMLFLKDNAPVRVQCALVENIEVKAVCKHIAQQAGFSSAYMLPEPPEESALPDGKTDSKPAQLDPLFFEAAEMVVTTRQSSITMIQRKFAIGFGRAARIMDQLEHAGIVGAASGSKPRTILIDSEAELDCLLESLKSNI